jgi:hypothetical protein
MNEKSGSIINVVYKGGSKLTSTLFMYKEDCILVYQYLQTVTAFQNIFPSLYQHILSHFSDTDESNIAATLSLLLKISLTNKEFLLSWINMPPDDGHTPDLIF